MLVLKPDLDKAVVAAGGGEQCAVRTEGHVQHWSGGGAAPHTLPTPLLLLTDHRYAGRPHRILPYLKRHSST